MKLRQYSQNLKLRNCWLYSLRTYTSHLTTRFVSRLTDLPWVLPSTELETTLVPELEDHIQKWRRFVDDTFVYLKNGSVEHVLWILNSFYKNINFSFEEERNNTLPFLDILLITDGEILIITVYRKDRHNNLYLHWNSFTQISWKRGTLKSLISRA